jgi:hypothetical protein
MIVCAVNSSVGGFAEFENVFLTGWLRAAVVVNDAAVAVYFDCVEGDFDGGVEFGAAIRAGARGAGCFGRAALGLSGKF